MPGPFSPIFIVGVPRSGTTLLRVLLDSHSEILALPETPWISGAYGGPLSLRQLLLDLMEGPYGAVRNVAGIRREDVLRAGRNFLEQLLEPALRVRGKSVLAFKTPSDIPHLEFMTELLPDARYIHITRDGRDVALSQLSKKGSFFLELRGYRSLSYANVLRRWVEWEQKARTVLYRGGLHVCHLRYEDLIADPAGEMRRVMAFLDLPFEQAMLDYASQSHDYPKWEAGSTDVAQRQSVSDKSVGKWRNAKKSVEVLYTLARYDQFLVAFGYPSSELGPNGSQRLLIAGYAMIRPVLETVSLVARRAHPLIRSPGRALASALLILSAILLLLPPGTVERAGMARDTLAPLLCFGVTFGFAAAFMPLLQRGGSLGSALLRAGLLMLAYVALLQTGQMLILGQPLALKPFVFCIIAILAALIAVMPLRMRQPARPA